MSMGEYFVLIAECKWLKGYFAKQQTQSCAVSLDDKTAVGIDVACAKCCIQAETENHADMSMSYEGAMVVSGISCYCQYDTGVAFNSHSAYTMCAFGAGSLEGNALSNSDIS